MKLYLVSKDGVKVEIGDVDIQNSGRSDKVGKDPLKQC
jgi:hypothetical protein